MTLDEVHVLKQELTADFEPAKAMHLVQKRIDTRQLNGFLRSILDRPMRELPQIFTSHEPLIVGAAQSGRRLRPTAIPSMHAFVAQGAEGEAEPNLSIGYSTVAKNDYQLEVRLQQPNVATILFAQEIVRRAGGQARVGEYRDLTAHARAAGASGAPGLSIGNSIGHPKSPPGTLGLFMCSRDGVGVFSNSHVLAWCGRAKPGDAVYVPHPKDAAGSKIGQLQRFSNLVQDEVIRFDAAFATLGGDVKYRGNIVPEDLPDGGKKIVAARKKPDPGTLKVRKIGRTSRSTTGTFSAVGVDPKLEYPGLGQVKLTGMMEILWDSPKNAFSEPGDSGSVVYRPDTMEAIAIVVGGGVRDVDGVSQGVSIACPLDQVIAEWGLSLV